MRMVLKVKFGTGNEARADALVVLAWVTRSWANALAVLTLDEEEGVQVLRLKGDSLYPMEDTLSYLLANVSPREGFEALLAVRVK